MERQSSSAGPPSSGGPSARSEQELKRTERLRERLGPVGVWWSSPGLGSAAVEREIAAELEQLGYRSLWSGESPMGKEAFTHAASLLGATSSLTIATGIANIWSRHPANAVAAAATLGEAYDDRFLLGLGVSHPPLVASIGQNYAKPLTVMREYLAGMDAAPYSAALPSEGVPRVLAALRPKMLALAGDQATGAHPYFVPVEHTARARQILGPEPLLAPEQSFVLETDPAVARAAARAHATMYLSLPNYSNNLRDLGFDDGDFADGGSDRLIDAVVAWGDADAICARVQEHLAAGADHVCLQPITAGATAIEDGRAALREIAPVVLALQPAATSPRKA